MVFIIDDLALLALMLGSGMCGGALGFAVGNATKKPCPVCGYPYYRFIPPPMAGIVYHPYPYYYYPYYYNRR